jgi:D-threonate/D-erythronate kinase
MKIAVIADDFTGTNATGVLLTKNGFSTATILQGLTDLKSFNYDAVCIDTDSRYSRKDLANTRVGKATSLMLNQNGNYFANG